VAAADFLSRALHRILYRNEPLLQALQGAAATVGDPLVSKWLASAISKVAEVAAEGSALAALGPPFTDDAAITSMARLWDVGKSEPIKVGKASPTEGALPAALYFALRYGSLEEALIANASVGGDSGARGVVIGMLLGAVHSEREGTLPARWMATLRSREAVERLLLGIASRRQQGGRVDGTTEL
jgi:hypothetical protein